MEEVLPSYGEHASAMRTEGKDNYYLQGGDSEDEQIDNGGE